ncbi:MAG: hypothetical protein U0361_20310 [Nitrospiraceae bacterium]
MFFSHAKAIGLKESNFRQYLRDASHLPSIFDDRQESQCLGFSRYAGLRVAEDGAEPTTKDPAVAIPGAFPFEAFAEEIEDVDVADQRRRAEDGTGPIQVRSLVRARYAQIIKERLWVGSKHSGLYRRKTVNRISLGLHVLPQRSVYRKGAHAGLPIVPWGFDLEPFTLAAVRDWEPTT